MRASIIITLIVLFIFSCSNKEVLTPKNSLTMLFVVNLGAGDSVEHNESIYIDLEKDGIQDLRLKQIEYPDNAYSSTDTFYVCTLESLNPGHLSISNGHWLQTYSNSTAIFDQRGYAINESLNWKSSLITWEEIALISLGALFSLDRGETFFWNNGYLAVRKEEDGQIRYGWIKFSTYKKIISYAFDTSKVENGIVYAGELSK